MSTNNMDRFEFRCIRPEETQQAIEIEQICFPPNEACSPKSLTERIKATAETFLVAEDKETGKLAAFLNGVPTDEDAFRDEFFTDISLSNPEGKNIMLLGLDVRPEYRMQEAISSIWEFWRASSASIRSAISLSVFATSSIEYILVILLCYTLSNYSDYNQFYPSCQSPKDICPRIKNIS